MKILLVILIGILITLIVYGIPAVICSGHADVSDNKKLKLYSRILRLIPIVNIIWCVILLYIGIVYIFKYCFKDAFDAVRELKEEREYEKQKMSRIEKINSITKKWYHIWR
jgi:amino acid transporter